MSSATVRKMHGVLQKALDQAVSDGLIPRNAAKGIRLPQGKKKEIRPLSPDEARTLLDATRGDRLVQELLGHATIAITLDTYSHVMPSMGDATARAMEDALA